MSDTWECPRCGEENMRGRSCCFMCYTDKPESLIKSLFVVREKDPLAVTCVPKPPPLVAKPPCTPDKMSSPACKSLGNRAGPRTPPGPGPKTPPLESPSSSRDISQFLPGSIPESTAPPPLSQEPQVRGNVVASKSNSMDCPFCKNPISDETCDHCKTIVCWKCRFCKTLYTLESVRCMVCKADRDSATGIDTDNDWSCRFCKSTNFHKRSLCFSCKAYKDGNAIPELDGGYHPLPGDDRFSAEDNFRSPGPPSAGSGPRYPPPTPDDNTHSQQDLRSSDPPQKPKSAQQPSPRDNRHHSNRAADPLHPFQGSHFHDGRGSYVPSEPMKRESGEVVEYEMGNGTGSGSVRYDRSSVRRTRSEHAPQDYNQLLDNFQERMETKAAAAAAAAVSPDQKMKRFKPGDWICRYCNELNFAKRETCFSCRWHKEEAMKPPAAVTPAKRRHDEHPNSDGNWSNTHEEHNINPTDLNQRKKQSLTTWKCPACSFRNLAFRLHCYQCGEPRDIRTGNHRKGNDWNCEECGTINSIQMFNNGCYKCYPLPSQNDPEMEVALSSGTIEQAVVNREDIRHKTLLPPKAKAFPASTTNRPSSAGEHFEKCIVSPKDWQCQLCDFFNVALRNFCKGCDAPRKSIVKILVEYRKKGVGVFQDKIYLDSIVRLKSDEEAEEELGPGDAEETWNCTLCHTDTPVARPTCQECNSVRPRTILQPHPSSRPGPRNRGPPPLTHPTRPAHAPRGPVPSYKPPPRYRHPPPPRYRYPPPTFPRTGYY